MKAVKRDTLIVAFTWKKIYIVNLAHTVSEEQINDRDKKFNDTIKGINN